MTHARPAGLAVGAGAGGTPFLHITAYRLWWIVITLTLIAAAAALCRLVPRKTL